MANRKNSITFVDHCLFLMDYPQLYSSITTSSLVRNSWNIGNALIVAPIVTHMGCHERVAVRNLWFCENHISWSISRKITRFILYVLVGGIKRIFRVSKSTKCVLKMLSAPLIRLQNAWCAFKIRLQNAWYAFKIRFKMFGTL